MLDDPGPWCLPVCVVDNRIPLEIRHIEQFRLEAHRAIFQRSELIFEECVDRPRIQDPVCQRGKLLAVFEEVHAKPHFDPFQHPLHHRGVTAHRDPLITRVEIVVIEGQPDRKPFDDERGKLRARSAPLLLRVATYQLLIDIGSDQGDGLLFQILWLGDPRSLPLFPDLSRRLLRSNDTPHLIEGVHVERQREQLSFIVRHDRIGIPVELRELLHVLPDAPVVGVEDVRPVFMHLDAFHILSINVSADAFAPVDHQDLFPGFFRLAGEHRAEEAGAHDQIVIFHKSPSSF